MRLFLKNIGMIKEADVKLDGLTVIAGENDTGKSTVGKSLFSLIKANLFVNNDKFKVKTLKDRLEWIFQKISKGGLLNENSFLMLSENNFILRADYKNNEFESQPLNKENFLDAIFIETPFIFNLFETLIAISNANSMSGALGFEIPYNYLWWDLFLKLSQQSSFKDNKIKNEDELKKFIKNIINGEFLHKKKVGENRWVFLRDSKEIAIENVAMGMKQFGILYALLINGYLSKDRIIIFDEPEVHLHPKWQLEYAKVLVELVKNGVKVLVNSHSPFFIEALELYSKHINANFYLAKKEEDFSIIKECEIFEIYDLLAESIDKLEEIGVDNLRW